jgi:hypothetical protein
VSKSSRCEKRPHEESMGISIKRKKYANRQLVVPYSIYAAKEQECLALQAKVTTYEQDYMRK